MEGKEGGRGGGGIVHFAPPHHYAESHSAPCTLHPKSPMISAQYWLVLPCTLHPASDYLCAISMSICPITLCTMLLCQVRLMQLQLVRRLRQRFQGGVGGVGRCAEWDGL